MAASGETTGRHAARAAQRPRARRRLTTPDEALASFMAARPTAIRGPETKRWRDVRLFSLRLPAEGEIALAPLSFYSVARFWGIAPRVWSEEGGTAPPRQRTDRGATLIHGAGIGLRYAWTAAHRVDFICLEPELVARVAEQCGWTRSEWHEVRASVQRHDPGCEYLIGALAEEAGRGTHPAQAALIESVAHALACCLVSRLGENAFAPVSEAGALGARAFRLVREHVVTNLGARLSLDELARVAGMSRFHFARQFRLRTHESPMGYVTRMRIERAKAELRLPGAKIADIAVSLGFADQSHFTRTFKQLTGSAPSSFAREIAEVAGARACKPSPLRPIRPACGDATLPSNRTEESP